MNWQRFFIGFVDALFPRFCVTCRREGETVCGDCLRLLPQQPVWQEVDGLRIWSAYAYHGSDLDRYMQAWKYRGARDFVQPWLRLVAWPQVEADLIVPVPLHKRRLLERGFNQAESIAQAVATTLHKPVATQALQRRRATKAQAQCDGEERRTNMKDAFVADSSVVRGKRVVLVDDVATTGSTLIACAQALRQAGAVEIIAICLARGGLDSNVTS